MVKISKLLWASNPAVGSGPIHSVHIHPDGTRFAFAQNSVVYVMNLEGVLRHVRLDEQQRVRFNLSKVGPDSASSSPDAYCSMDYMNYLEMELARIGSGSGMEIGSSAAASPVNTIRFSPDGSFLAIGREDFIVTIHELTWTTVDVDEGNAEDEENEDDIVVHAPSAVASAGSSRGEVVQVLGDVDDGIDWGTGVVSASAATAAPVAASAPISSVRKPKKAKNVIEKVERWPCVATLSHHTREVLGLAWSPSSDLLATSDMSGRIHVYSYRPSRTFVLVHSLQWSGEEGTEGSVEVRGLRFDPIGRYLLAESDHHILLYELVPGGDSNSGTEFRQKKSVLKHTLAAALQHNTYLRPTWSPTGDHFVAMNWRSEGTRKAVVAMLARNGDVVAQLRAPDEIVCAEFNPRLFYGRERRKYDAYFATGGTSAAMTVWCSARTRPSLIVRFTHEKVTDISWHPDGYLLLFASADGTLTLVRFSEEELGSVVDKAEFKRVLNEKFGTGVVSNLMLEMPKSGTGAVKILSPEQFESSGGLRMRFLIEEKRKEIEKKMSNDDFDPSALVGKKRRRGRESRDPIDTGLRRGKRMKIDHMVYFEDRYYRFTSRSELHAFDAVTRQLSWAVHLNSVPDKIVSSPSFVVVATTDGYLHVFSSSGVRLSPPMLVGSNDVTKLKFLRCNKTSHFLTLDAGLNMVVYDALKQKKVLQLNLSFFRTRFPPEAPDAAAAGESGAAAAAGAQSVAPIQRVGITDGGSPVVVLKNLECFLYDGNWKEWVRVSSDYVSPFVATSPSVFEQDSTGTGTATAAGEKTSSSVSQLRTMPNLEFMDQAALLKKIDDLETNLAIARRIGNADDFSRFLTLYVRVLSSSMAATMDLKLKSLFAWLLGLGDRSYEPKILGIDKTTLLEKLLQVLPLSHQRLREEYAGILRERNEASLDEMSVD